MSFWALEEISFGYEGAAGEVFSGVSLSIPRGQAVGLVGPNGSGKTTLGKILVGLLTPSSGRVLLEGEDVAKMPLARVGARVGYVFQNPERQFFTASVAEEVAFGLRFRDGSGSGVAGRVEEMLDYFDLSHRREAFPFNLSRGEKQRLALASILVLEPAYVILDEPTTGLDPGRKERFCLLLERVRARGTGYLLISHDRELISQMTNRRLVMEGGRVRESALLR